MIIGMRKTESFEVAGTLGLVSVKALSIIHYTLAFCASLRMLDLELGFDLLNAKLRADCPEGGAGCRLFVALKMPPRIRARRSQKRAVLSPPPSSGPKVLVSGCLLSQQ